MKRRPRPVLPLERMRRGKLASRPHAQPHFQVYQFDSFLPRRANTDDVPSLSPDGNAAVYGDKSLAGKIAMALDTPCPVWTEAAFRTA